MTFYIFLKDKMLSHSLMKLGILFKIFGLIHSKHLLKEPIPSLKKLDKTRNQKTDNP